MSHQSHFNIGFEAKRVDGVDKVIGIRHSGLPLRLDGLNLPVEIAVSSAVVRELQDSEPRSAAVLALLDTGASKTVIDSQIAEDLGLVPAGVSRSITANGAINTPDYFVDVSFSNSKLRSIANLQVGSCNLVGFELAPGKTSQTGRGPKNIGALIGRDIMSIWNIVWHGPTSTVLISD